MANFNIIEKDKLERLFSMRRGDVLDFTNRTFFEFFREMNIDINDRKYRDYNISDCPANRLRAFWKQESDNVVGKVLVKLIEYVEYALERDQEVLSARDLNRIADCRAIADKLLGKTSIRNIPQSKEKFLPAKFDKNQIDKLPIASDLRSIAKERFNEAQVCFENGAYLAAIVMAGSTLEAALMGAAEEYSKQFNKSTFCPKNGEKTKKLHEWTLAEYINVGADIGLLSDDVKKFSHALRDFRNYIHPLRQISNKFKPDEHTAEICLKVLKAALHDLIKNKPDG